MNFVRKGPRYLFFRTKEPDNLEETLLNLGGRKTECTEALEQAEEENTIVFITPVRRKKTLVEDAVSIILFPENSLIVLEDLINSKMSGIINKVDMGPGQIVMRIPQKGLKVIEEIEETYEADQISIIEGIDKGEANDTILTFTKEPIRTKINSLKLVEKSLLISKPVSVLHKELRRDVVRHITHGLEPHQWYEVKINIYDAGGKYNIHYKRLVQALADIEVGFILGESWTKDHAFALLSVAAYQVRLFTFLEPKKVKELLISLEYDDGGERIVDYDLYHESKKVEWREAVDEKIGRASLGKKLRQRLFSRLSDETVSEIKKLESKLEEEQTRS